MNIKNNDNFFKGILSRITNMREATILLINLILIVSMFFLSEHFLTYSNIRTMLLAMSNKGIIALGMTLVLIVGGIDLSVGSVMGLTAVIAGQLFLVGLNPWLAALIAIIAAAMIGLTNAFFINEIGLNPLITTLGTMSIARGLAYVITRGMPLSLFALPDNFRALGGGGIYGLPYLVIIFIGLVIIGEIFYKNTSIIRKAFYVGSNQDAAKFSGLNIKKIKYGVYIFVSIVAGLSGVLTMSRFASASPQMGVGLELQIIAACVIGGASLKGGEGSVLGTFLGVILLAIIDTSLILLHVPVYYQRLVSGVVLIAAVSVDCLTRSKKQTSLID